MIPSIFPLSNKTKEFWWSFKNILDPFHVITVTSLGWMSSSFNNLNRFKLALISPRIMLFVVFSYFSFCLSYWKKKIARNYSWQYFMQKNSNIHADENFSGKLSFFFFSLPFFNKNEFFVNTLCLSTCKVQRMRNNFRTLIQSWAVGVVRTLVRRNIIRYLC